jgi:hypothetical protein
VTGRVVDADGKPLSGVRVSLWPDAKGPFSAYRSAAHDFETRTDSAGKFRLDVPLDGVSFQLGFQVKGQYADSPKTARGLKVESGKTRELGDLTLQTEE